MLNPTQKIAAAKERRAKRRAKAKILFGAVSLAALKKQHWDALSLWTRIQAKRGPQTLPSGIVVPAGVCRIGRACDGHGPIDCSCHVLRKTRGQAIYYSPEAIFAGCNACNDGDRWHPDLYQDWYEQRFGREYMDKLKALARTTVDYGAAYHKERRDYYRAMLAGRQ